MKKIDIAALERTYAIGTCSLMGSSLINLKG